MLDSQLLNERFTVDGVEWRVTIIDERPDMDLDPTLLIYRGLEEDPIATVHLAPRAACYDKNHIVARPVDE